MSSSRSNRNPKLKRRTPSPPPRRERGKKYSEDDNNASNSASTPRYTAYPTTLLVRNLSQDTRFQFCTESFGFLIYPFADKAIESLISSHDFIFWND
ncbi:hypothetical protein SUGI_1107480 [Cryptomeria japonica]|nr:hypothetical protein SUGI_1107480 [Cryptomeria japonica]